MKVRYINVNKLLIMDITEEVDHHNTLKIKNRADYEIQKYMPKIAVFDFSNVTFMDSSGIGMLIGRYKLVSMFRWQAIYYEHKTKCKKDS